MRAEQGDQICASVIQIRVRPAPSAVRIRTVRLVQHSLRTGQALSVWAALLGEELSALCRGRHSRKGKR